MNIKELLEGIYPGKIDARFDGMDILSISCDSRKVMMGGLFVALQGKIHDGSAFINDVIGRGAFAVATKSDVSELSQKHPDVCFVRVEDIDGFLRQVVKRFYGNPSNKVRTIGITGTNGKTTVAYMIESILKAAQKECGVIGTVNYRLGQTVVPAKQTTPSFIDIQHFLTGLAWQHVPYCVIEVSSHALTQGRVDGIDFKGGIFTNLTSDHLDYHETRENYFSAKSLLFKGLASESTAVINADDPYGKKLLPLTQAGVITYGIESKADVAAEDVSMDLSGSRFRLVFSGEEAEITTGLVGMYNIYNILAAAALCLAEGISFRAIQDGIEKLKGIPGRVERVDCGQDFYVFIDYAHTQDALKNVLTTIRKISEKRIICVFGCGGDRDTSKRPLMGQVCGELADFSFVTSDNPRSEDPQAIIDQITPGFNRDNYRVVVDREDAIREALEMAEPGDTVLVAGKGHETYQIFADGTRDFDERKIIRNCLK